MTGRFLRIAARVRPVVVDAESVVMHSEDGPLVLRGRPYATIVPRIDGRTTDEALVATLGADGLLEGWIALERLQRLGCVTRDEPPPVAPHPWCTLPSPPIAGDDLCWHALGASLDTVAWGAGGGGHAASPGALAIVLADDYLADGVEAMHARRNPTRQPWLLARPVGRSLWLGPLFDDADAPCWHCLAHAMRRNRPVEAFLDTRGLPSSPPVLAPDPVALARFLGALAAAIAAWRARAAPHPLAGTLHEIAADGNDRGHDVRRRPQCPACGDPARYPAGALTPLVLTANPDIVPRASSDGGDLDAPDDAPSLARLQRMVSPLTGIATSLERVPHHCGPAIELHVATQSRIRPGATVESLLLDATQRAAGKGRFERESMLGALAEAAERASGTFHGDEPRLRATRRALGVSAIAPNDVALFSERQLAESATSSARGRRPAPPLPFDDDLEIDWTPIWSLTRKQWRYLATASLYYDMPLPSHERVAVADSNGCAAGRSPADAAVRAVLELVERDAVAVWWYNRLPRPQAPLDASSPWIDEWRHTYERLGRDLWCLDLTHDIGIPVCAAVSRRREGNDERILLGFGAGLSIDDAATRALMEMNQLLAALDAAGDAAPPDDEFAAWLATARVAASPHLRPHDVPRPAACHLAPAGSATEQLESLHAALRAAGLELLVLDQSRPDIGVHVARAVVPGMRHFWPRLAPGRLYDVPVALGWRGAPLPESALNPLAIFL